MGEPQSNVSETVLAELPGRVLTFLKGVATNSVIRAQLAAVGFTSVEYKKGWDLLHTATGYVETAPAAPQKSAAFSAMQELDEWDEDGFRRIRAPLDHMYPAQLEYVFAGGLAASTGAQAVLGVKTLLARLDDLENGADRKATRKQDHAALATLAERGFPKEERERLAALVKTAQTLEEPAAATDTVDAATRRTALLDLYAWYKDWSESARSVVKKRAHQITLGIAKRRASKKKDAALVTDAASTKGATGTKDGDPPKG